MVAKSAALVNEVWHGAKMVSECELTEEINAEPLGGGMELAHDGGEGGNDAGGDVGRIHGFIGPSALAHRAAINRDQTANISPAQVNDDEESSREEHGAPKRIRHSQVDAVPMKNYAGVLRTDAYRPTSRPRIQFQDPATLQGIICTCDLQDLAITLIVLYVVPY